MTTEQPHEWEVVPGNGQGYPYFQRGDEVMGVYTTRDYLNDLETRLDDALEALAQIVACIDTSATYPEQGLGGNVAAACKVLAKTAQVADARDLLARIHKP